MPVAAASSGTLLANDHAVLRQLGFVLVAVLSATSATADCIANGHFTVAATSNPLSGSRYPYTENLSHRSADLPVPNEVSVGTSWTKLQSGCAAFEEKNVLAAGPVNLLVRASIHLEYGKPQPPPGTRYELQLRLGDAKDDAAPRVVMDETRRFDGRYPQSVRFASMVRDLPAGNWVLSMWMRLLDVPDTQRATLDLQWITAQGVPNVYPAAMTQSDGDVAVGEQWTRVAPRVELDSRYDVDAILQATYEIAEASDDADALEIAFATDARRPGARSGVVAIPKRLPDSGVAFDHAAALDAGRHYVELWMRAPHGDVVVRHVQAQSVTFPRRALRPQIIPLQTAEELRPGVIVAQLQKEQPASMSPICGRWTKLLDMTLEPSGGPASWTLEGFVEVLGSDVSGYGQIGIDATHHEVDRFDPSRETDYVTDMGMFEFQAARGRDGIYFYGDCSKWGNFGEPTHVSVWIRRIEGCNDAPFGGGFQVGKRWLSIKLLPSEGPHLP